MITKYDYETHFRYLLSFVLYIHNFPFSSESEISKACKFSRATFFRMKHYANVFGVTIEYLDVRNKKGYKVLDYGIFDKRKLNKIL